MNELFDVLNEKGEFTNIKETREGCHKKGLWHGSIHILIINNKHDKTLLQKRCELKDLYPNTWDIAVGGHISAGEDDITSAKRELEEELGLDSSQYQIEFIEKITEKLDNNGFINNEWVSIYVLYSDIDINDIVLKKEEVSEIKWYSKEELNRLIINKKIIPHKRDYELLNEILK